MKYRGMWFALLLALPWECMGAEPEWLSLKSPNFEILSSVGARETRAVAENLELASGVFEKMLGTPPPKIEPVHVVIFRARKEYDRHSPIESVVAHYGRSSGRDYIAIANATDGVLPSALHELFHASARRAGWNLPVWLDEGLAEVSSTFRYSSSKLFVGAAVRTRRQMAETGSWTPLPVLLETTHGSAEYSRKDGRHAFYNAAWALAHMLIFHPAYGHSFGTVLQRLGKGEPSKAVLEEMFRKPLKAIEDDLTNYLRYGRLRETEFPIPNASANNGSANRAGSFEITAAPRFDVALAMADLNNRAGADQGARQTLEGLAVENPERPEPWVSLGYLALRHGLVDDMDKFFSKAIDLGSRNPVMLWEYAGMAVPASPRNGARALEFLLEMRPGDQPALLLLAEIQTQMREFRAAIQTLTRYGNAREEDSLRYFRTMAIAKSEIDDRLDSRNAALKWLELAEGIEERDKADRVLKYLDSLDNIDRNARAALEQTGEPKVEFFDAGPPPVIRPSVSGRLVSFDCQRERYRLVLQTSHGQSTFLVDDFGLVTVYGLRGKTFEIACGPQKPVPVRIQYDPPVAGEKGIDGLARGIHFEPETGPIP